MVKTLTADELSRIMVKHCSHDEQQLFTTLVAQKANLVTALLNNELRDGPLSEKDIVAGVRRTLWFLKKGGDA